MSELLIGGALIGGTLITLFTLDAKGVISVNEKAVKGVFLAGGIYVGFRFLTLLRTFI